MQLKEIKQVAELDYHDRNFEICGWEHEITV